MSLMSLEKEIIKKLRERNIPARVVNAIIDYVKLLMKQFEITAIILYGSFAYGTPDINSDIDLIVVSPNFDIEYDKLVLLKRRISRFRPSRISSLWLGEKEIFLVFEGFSGVLLDAIYYGLVLYDKKGIIRALKNKLEEAMSRGIIKCELGMWKIDLEDNKPLNNV